MQLTPSRAELNRLQVQMENGRFSFVLFFVFFLFRFPLLSLGFGCETCSIHFFPFSAFTPYWFVFSLMGSDWTRFFKNCFFGESSPTDCVFIFVRRGRFCGVPSFRFLSLAIFAVFFQFVTSIRSTPSRCLLFCWTVSRYRVVGLVFFSVFIFSASVEGSFIGFSSRVSFVFL